MYISKINRGIKISNFISMVLSQQEIEQWSKMKASVCGHVCEYGGQLDCNVQFKGNIYEIVINCTRTIDTSFREKKIKNGLAL